MKPDIPPHSRLPKCWLWGKCKDTYNKKEDMNSTIWIDTRLNEEEMNFLNDAISDVKGVRGTVIDKDNWFFKSVLKKLTERMFYRDWNAYYKYHIEKEEPLPEFEMCSFWVNYMKQHEIAPVHSHVGLYSFVIFMKIPTFWEEQHAIDNVFVNSGEFENCASNFAFLLGGGDGTVHSEQIRLSPEDEGRMVFFPAWLKHMVYPFYECEEERVTIAGNIDFVDPKII